MILSDRYLFWLIFMIVILLMGQSISYNIFKHKNIDQTVTLVSYISGYVTSTCKYYNTTECQKLIDWGRDKIDKLI